MSIELHAARARWENLTAADLAAGLPSRIRIGDIPALPLARALDMPARAGFARGSLSLSLSDLHLSLSADAPIRVEHGSGDGAVVTVRLQAIALQGVQTLQGTQIWEPDLDGAGTGLPPGARRRGGAGEGQDLHPTWIKTANDQRAALQNVPGGNGAALLSTYSTHRAAFNDVFSRPETYPFQSGWGVDAITQMSQDTNDAVNNGGVVNDQAKLYGGTTYNGNAQNQQLALLTALTSLANPQNPQDPNDPYNQAAASTLTFNTSVLNNTGAQKVQDIPQQTKDGVYQIVQNGQPADRHSVAEVHAFLNGSPIGGRDAQGNTWTMVLSEDERAFVRKLQAEQAEHLARLAAAKPVALTQGGVRAELTCFVYLQFADDAGGLRLIDGRIELDGFDLDLDDSRWDDLLGVATAAEARQALSQTRFLQSLVHDRVADALERELVPPLARVFLDARS